MPSLAVIISLDICRRCFRKLLGILLLLDIEIRGGPYQIKDRGGASAVYGECGAEIAPH